MKASRIKSRRGSPADEVAELLSKRDRRASSKNDHEPIAVPASSVLRYDVLGRLCAEKRRKDGLSLRDVARETGISASTLSRIEHGKTADTDKVVILSRWVGLTVDRFADPVVEGVEQQVKALLLSDPKLNRESRDAMCSVFAVLYRQMTRDLQVE